MLRSVLLTALLAFSASVSAEDFSYNYFGAGYTRINLDDGFVDIDGDAFGLNGSYEINESFYVFAGYGMGEFEEAGVTVDMDTLRAGIGWHTPLSDRVDLVTDLSYEYIDLSAFGVSVDDNGFGLGVGLRFAATDNVELNAGINYVDFGDGGDDTGFGIGALFGVSDNIDIGLSADWADDTSAYGVNGRFYFGN